MREDETKVLKRKWGKETSRRLNYDRLEKKDRGGAGGGNENQAEGSPSKGLGHEQDPTIHSKSQKNTIDTAGKQANTRRGL